MRTTTPPRFLACLLTSALLLSACGTADNENAVAPLETSFEKLEAPDAVTGQIGETIDAGNGIGIVISGPRPIALSDEATGVEDLSDQATVNAVDVTVQNDSDATFAPYTMTVQVLESDGVTPCVDVFDDASNIVGTPFEDIAPGNSAEFTWGYACSGVPGDAVTVRVLLDIEGTPIDVPITLVN